MEPPSKRVKTHDSTTNGSGLTEDDTITAVAEPSLIDNLQDLYMETVDRAQLDFDQEKLCSVTLSNLNVYACLICGKYFSGRSRSTPAFFHSLEADHHVFLNLSTLRAYILPDSFENTNTALEDIKHNVSPKYTKDLMRNLSKDSTTCYDFSRTPYRPGFVGMNNLKGSDHIGVVIHALSHVPPIRNYFLLEDLNERSTLVQSFSLLLRKQWSSKLLKAHISPHEFIRRASVSTDEKKNKEVHRVREPQEFMTFLSNTFHQNLGGSRTNSKAQSIISSCFQGFLQIETQKVFEVTETANNDRLRFESSSKIATRTSPFMMISLDLPPTPLFQDEVQRNIIPQVSLLELLSKYNGAQVQELPGERRRYSLTKLPPFLIFNIKRFKTTSFSTEKNATIVNFPLRSLDMAPYLSDDAAKASVASGSSAVYDLIVNITHESVFSSIGDESHVFRTQIKDRTSDRWVQMEGLFVEEIKKDVISIGETVLQIWEKRK